MPTPLTLLLVMASVAAAPLPSTPATDTTAPRTLARALGDAFADVAQDVAPTAVHVEVEKAAPLTAGLAELMRDLQVDGGGKGPDHVGTGSGVIIQSDGLVLTNHHVIAGATRITVTLHDRRRFPAVLVGSDPRTDIALLQILTDEELPAAQLADSDALRIGEWVIAVGHPFDFDFTVTAGIVSARGRRNLARDEIQDYIQTDAAVNPGSSGGPLFDLDGRVVGINTAIYTPGGSAGHAGIAFAIPSNMARRVADELLDTGQVTRSVVGLGTRDRPPAPGNPRPGAEIVRVQRGGPADLAGLAVGDVIIAVSDEPVTTREDLRGIVLATATGSPLRVRYERADAVLEATLRTTTGDGPATRRAPPKDAWTWAGLTLAPATATRALNFDNPMPARDPPGLIVLAVDPASSAAASGILPGDILLELGGEQISDEATLAAATEGRTTVMLSLWRNGTATVAAVGGI